MPESLLDLPISFFESSTANVPCQQTTLRRIVTTRYYKTTTEAICAEPDKAKQDEMKKHQPAFTPVALLKHRKKDTSLAEKILNQWPMLMGDIDKKDNPGVDMAQLKQLISRLPYVLLCAYSIRRGLWFVVRLPDNQTPETLEKHFLYLLWIFSEKFKIILDRTKGKNPHDLRYVSYDDEPYLNESPTIMSGTYVPPAPKPQPTNYNRTTDENEGKLLSRLVKFIEKAGEGGRHEALLKAAKLAGGFVAASRMDEQTAVLALETAASEWPQFSKSQKTIRDGIKYGMASPVYVDIPAPNYEPVRRQRPTPKKTVVNRPAPVVVNVAPAVPQQTERLEIRVPTVEPTVLPSKQIVTSFAEQYANPGSILKPDESQIERLTVELSDDYPRDWDEPSPPGAVPTIKQLTYFEWQRTHPSFSQLGLASLTNHKSS